MKVQALIGVLLQAQCDKLEAEEAWGRFVTILEQHNKERRKRRKRCIPC
jgi:hypothetical protein